MANKKSSKFDYLYRPADTEVIFNENDPVLKPIHYKLPSPPPIHTIEGYGLPPNQQKWKRPEMPKKLAKVQAKEYDALEKYWDEIELDYDYYKDELWFIEQEWERRRNGHWLFINGKPTFLTGWNYFYLAWFKMYNESGSEYADYRDRDRKFFLMCQYCATTKDAVFSYRITNLETKEVKYSSDKSKVKKMDEEFHVEQGEFIVNRGERTVLGFNYPKLRREGATTKIHSNMMEIATRMEGAKVAMQSMTDDSAFELYNEKMLVGWRGLPFFFVPVNPDNSNPKEGIKLEPPKKNTTGKKRKALYSYILYGNSNEKYFDGQNLKAFESTEAGKTEQADIGLRHDVVKKTLTLGDGKIIKGINFTDSTVEDMRKGGENFKKLCRHSHWHERVDGTGQTLSGNINFFISSDEGLEGFIDEWGNSKREEAREWILAQRDGYRAANDNEKLIELIRRAPLTFSESFTAAIKNRRFPVARMVDRRNMFLFEDNPACRYGRLEWVGGQNPNHGYQIGKLPTLRDFVTKKAYVRFVECRKDEEWEWEVSYLPNQDEENKFYVDGAGIIRPSNTHLFSIGADPIKMAVLEEGSDYSISILRKRNWAIDNPHIPPLAIDPLTGRFAHKTGIFCGNYRRRPKIEHEGDEQVLMACLLWGCKAFPEINVPSTMHWFIDRGFGGFLLHKIDIVTGVESKTAGATTTGHGGIINVIFNSWNYYWLENAERENHMGILDDSLEIEDDMNPFDNFVSGGYALMGASEEVRVPLTTLIEKVDDAQFVEIYVD